LIAQARATANQAAASAPQQVQVTRAQAGSADARVQQAEAALQEARLRLEYTTIVAPVAGWVTNKTVQIGQVVQPGQGLLALVPLEDIWVTAYYKETQLKRMRPGQPANIHVDAYGRTYRGRVESIAAATGERFSLLPPENASGNFVKVVQRVPVKIAIDKGQDPDNKLRIGLSVTPTVLIR
jgi:membrane fusion protein (multidrug efflux system)